MFISEYKNMLITSKPYQTYETDPAMLHKPLVSQDPNLKIKGLG